MIFITTNLITLFQGNNKMGNLSRSFGRAFMLMTLILFVSSCASRSAALVSDDQPQDLGNFENFEEAFTQAAERSVIGDYVGKGRASNLVIYFDYDSAYLALDGRAALDTEIQKIIAAINAKGGNKVVIRIEGHTDERGSDGYNLALGQRRSDSVARYMVTKGIGRNQVQSVSYGESRPLSRGGGEAAWAENRRVEINY